MPESNVINFEDMRNVSSSDVSKPFRIESEFNPAGDQPEAIRQLVEG